MDKRKRYIIATFFGTVVIACLCVPWSTTYGSIQYRFLLDPPLRSTSIAFGVLAVEIVLSAAICGLSVLLIDEWKQWFNLINVVCVPRMLRLRRALAHVSKSIIIRIITIIVFGAIAWGICVFLDHFELLNT